MLSPMGCRLYLRQQVLVKVLVEAGARVNHVDEK